MEQLSKYLSSVLQNMPQEWYKLTTHRLDIYNEEKAKTDFLNEFELLYAAQNAEKSSLERLPTAFDYIRLGHPLSCVLEWSLAKVHHMDPDHVIGFSSAVMPIMAVLRKNLLTHKKTRILYSGKLPAHFDADMVSSVYGYDFELTAVDGLENITAYDGSTIYMNNQLGIHDIQLSDQIDFYVYLNDKLGSIIFVNGPQNASYVKEIQHVRRRESIAMTPQNTYAALQLFVGQKTSEPILSTQNPKEAVHNLISDITGSHSKSIIGSSGLSVQYAIMMGLIDYAQVHFAGKDIKFIVPPNCYGGTNDQARRVAACRQNVEIVDLPVDSGHDMVSSLEKVLEKVAAQDAVPMIIVEIPTNPRVEVPNLQELEKVLSKRRKNKDGSTAIEPIFIIDQTFCPNVSFLRDEDILSSIQTISYVSGSKFPSGGLCTAGYASANQKASGLMDSMERHLLLCDNQATTRQLDILAQQMPSMIERIAAAYQNTQSFVDFIHEALPSAKINFVSEDLVAQHFTPSVFSLDLPTKGTTPSERETYKRALNDKLIHMMINNISESKYCVSYGQLKGCYWTIPATSTQGTTQEKDKDYIARVSCSAHMDLAKHKEIFNTFVSEIEA